MLSLKQIIRFFSGQEHALRALVREGDHPGVDQSSEDEVSHARMSEQRRHPQEPPHRQRRAEEIHPSQRSEQDLKANSYLMAKLIFPP